MDKVKAVVASWAAWVKANPVKAVVVAAVVVAVAGFLVA